MDILVIGSMNMDLVIKSKRYPVKGETITGSNFKQIPGGKGANQACAIAKLGGDVGFIGACGQDAYGKALLANLEKWGVNVDHVSQENINTGVAMITVEEDGDNRIIIVPGANQRVSTSLIDTKEEYIKQANIILLQMEIPLETVLHIIKLAKKYDTKVILDPAPVQILPEYIYNDIDIMLPNEIEITGLLPAKELKSTEAKVNRLLELGTKKVILTQGAEGVTLFTKGKKKHFQSEKVDVVDTTAAGDSFAGALAYSLNLGKSIEEAIKYANLVAGLTVTKFGAQSSLPNKDDVIKYISQNK